jgi:hypothetical protein
MPIFYGIPMAYLPEGSAAGGLALINCLGLTGGFFSPFFLGWIRDQTGGLTAGLWVISGSILAGALLLLITSRAPVSMLAGGLPAKRHAD